MDPNERQGATTYHQGGYSPSQPPYSTDYGINIVNSENQNEFEETEQNIRRRFINIVYSILTVQLLITWSIIVLFCYNESITRYVRSNPSLFYVSIAILILTLIAMACCSCIRRKTPINLIFLGLFTLSEAFFLGVTATRYAPDEVVLAVGTATVISFVLTLFACQTKWDLTVFSGALIVGCISLVVFGIIFRGPTTTIMYSSLGALIFSIYLIIDMQIMISIQ